MTLTRDGPLSTRCHTHTQHTTHNTHTALCLSHTVSSTRQDIRTTPSLSHRVLAQLPLSLPLALSLTRDGLLSRKSRYASVRTCRPRAAVRPPAWGGGGGRGGAGGRAKGRNRWRSRGVRSHTHMHSLSSLPSLSLSLSRHRQEGPKQGERLGYAGHWRRWEAENK